MSKMDQDIISLLRKYVSNTCTAAELEKVKRMLKTGGYDQEWNTVLQEAAEHDVAAEDNVPDFDAASVLRRINTTIRPVKQINVYRWSLSIAASLLVMVSVGYLVWKNQLQQVKVMPQLSLVTNAGQQKKIVLTDGSEVVLNCGSTLKYTAQFTGKQREVYLEGEAFFQVKHDPKHSFIVHTNRVKVQVLGTSFNVRSYVKDRKSSVSVATGKVGVNGNKAKGTYMLLPGDQLSYNKNNQFEKRISSLDDILGWQKGILIFRLETIEEIAPALERYYGINIHINTLHLANKQVTASFTRKALPQVLEVLSQTAGFSYVIKQNEVYIN